MVKIGGVPIYQNGSEAKLNVYRDLWLTDEERKNRLNFGIASENVRKIWSGFNPKPTDADSVLLTSKTPRLRLKLDKTFSGNGSFYPSGLGQLMFQIQFPKADDIMIASTGNKVEGYSLEDVLLRFEVISCMSLKSEEDSGMGVNLAKNASNIYESGKEIFFKQVMLDQEEIWPKDSLVRNIQNNTPIKMLNAIVLLFKNVDETDSENFVSANIQSVEVDLEARTMLRNNGLREEDLYEEARRLFGARSCSDGMSKLRFERNAFALVLDFRTVNQLGQRGRLRN